MIEDKPVIKEEKINPVKKSEENPPKVDPKRERELEKLRKLWDN